MEEREFTGAGPAVDFEHITQKKEIETWKGKKMHQAPGIEFNTERG